MDYEKKYKEALERARKWYNDSHITIGLKGNLKDIFPELAEPDDERIRKILIDYFDDANKSDENPLQSYGIHTDEVIAWLEKQGNEPKVSYTTIVETGNGGINALVTIPFGAKDSELQEASYHIPEGFHAEIEGDKITIKKGEKPTAWSEEDEVKINRIVDCLENLNVADNDILLKDVDWLKSLRPQNNITEEELAQAKKDAYNDALDKIEYHSGEPTFDNGWSAAIWYLKKKNAMPQTQWKPSDEQMEALKHYVDTTMDGDIDLLYQDLKKLKG